MQALLILTSKFYSQPIVYYDRIPALSWSCILSSLEI